MAVRKRLGILSVDILYLINKNAIPITKTEITTMVIIATLGLFLPDYEI